MSELTPGLAMQAYLLGRRLAGQRKIKKSTNVYDNEWPIEWSMSEVANNSARLTDPDMGCDLIKVSNLTPALDEMGNASLTINKIFDGSVIDCPNVATLVDEPPWGTLIVGYVNINDTLFLYLFMICRTANVDFDGVTFPETGIYYALTDTANGNASIDDGDIIFKLEKSETV